jgi:hypothetical protein
VLGADGTAMFVAHDVHQAEVRQADLRQADLRQADLRQAELHQAEVRQAEVRQADLRQADLRQADPVDEQHPDNHGRPPHRRGALPVTVLASAAAVVAAGTFGSHVSTLAATDGPTPAGAASVAGSLTGTRNVAVRVPGPLIGTGSLLATDQPSAGRATTARQPVTPLLATAPTSVTVTPARLPLWQFDGASTAGRLQAGLPPMLIGLPTATP